MLYFLLQYLGAVIESIRPVRSRLRDHRWLGRLWTLAVVLGPVGLLLHQGFVDDVLLPMLATAGVPGLEP